MDLKHIKAVAFDLDGTLCDSIPDLAIAANKMREHLNLAPLAEMRIQEHVGDGIASLVHRAITDQRNAEAEPALWEAGYSFFIRYYREHLADHTLIYPGVKVGLELLKVLRLPLVVITNKSERLAVPLLEILELGDLFSLVIGGDTLPEKKPSALPLQHTAMVLNLKTEEIAMVGDSINDILSARAAGSPAIAVSYGYADAAQLGADIVIDNLAELYDLMKNG
jgi:phosphoglycolate phosphatase